MLSPTSKSLLLLCARRSSALGSLPTASPSRCCGQCLQRDVLASPFPPWAPCHGGGGRLAEVPAGSSVTGGRLQHGGFLSPSEMCFSPCRALSWLLRWLTGRRGANDSDEDEGLISMGRGGKREKRERVFHCNKIDTTSPRQSRSAASPSSPASCALCLTPEDKWGLGSGCEVQRGAALLKASVNKCLEVSSRACRQPF